jgi:translation initiation factor 2-alpha kinase 4
VNLTGRIFCQVIFFEMCFPMGTDMERFHTIRDVRTPQVRLPSGWPFGEKDSQTQIVRMLLRHDPMQRPSANDLLQSHLL